MNQRKNRLYNFFKNKYFTILESLESEQELRLLENFLGVSLLFLEEAYNIYLKNPNIFNIYGFYHTAAHSAIQKRENDENYFEKEHKGVFEHAKKEWSKIRTFANFISLLKILETERREKFVIKNFGIDQSAFAYFREYSIMFSGCMRLAEYLRNDNYLNGTLNFYQFKDNIENIFLSVFLSPVREKIKSSVDSGSYQLFLKDTKSFVNEVFSPNIYFDYDEIHKVQVKEKIEKIRNAMPYIHQYVENFLQVDEGKKDFLLYYIFTLVFGVIFNLLHTKNWNEKELEYLWEFEKVIKQKKTLVYPYYSIIQRFSVLFPELSSSSNVETTILRYGKVFGEFFKNKIKKSQEEIIQHFLEIDSIFFSDPSVFIFLPRSGFQLTIPYIGISEKDQKLLEWYDRNSPGSAQKIKDTRNNVEQEILKRSEKDIKEYISRSMENTFWRFHCENHDTIVKIERIIANDPELNAWYLFHMRQSWFLSLDKVIKTRPDADILIPKLSDINIEGVKKYKDYLLQTGNTDEINRFSRMFGFTTDYMYARSINVNFPSELHEQLQGAILEYAKEHNNFNNLVEIGLFRAQGLNEEGQKIEKDYDFFPDKQFCFWDEISLEFRKKFEDYIASYSDIAIKYAKTYLMNPIFEKKFGWHNHPLFSKQETERNLEKIIEKENSHNLYLYAKEVMGGRWTEVAPTVGQSAEYKIAQDPQDAVDYAMEIIKNSWDQAYEPNSPIVKTAHESIVELWNESPPYTKLIQYSIISGTPISKLLKKYSLRHKRKKVQDLETNLAERKLWDDDNADFLEYILFFGKSLNYKEIIKQKPTFYEAILYFAAEHFPVLFAERVLLNSWEKETWIGESIIKKAFDTVIHANGSQSLPNNKRPENKFIKIKDVPQQNFVEYAKRVLKMPWNRVPNMPYSIVRNAEGVTEAELFLEYTDFLIPWGGWHGILVDSSLLKNYPDSVCSDPQYQQFANAQFSLFIIFSRIKKEIYGEFFKKYVFQTMKIGNNGYSFHDLFAKKIIEKDVCLSGELLILETFSNNELLEYIKNHLHSSFSQHPLYDVLVNEQGSGKEHGVLVQKYKALVSKREKELSKELQGMGLDRRGDIIHSGGSKSVQEVLPSVGHQTGGEQSKTNSEPTLLSGDQEELQERLNFKYKKISKEASKVVAESIRKRLLMTIKGIQGNRK